MNCLYVKWRRELIFNARYIAAGFFNTAVGVAAIWLFTRLGFPPAPANLFGYMLGLLINFAISRNFVFQSSNRINIERALFIGAFVISYCINLIVLYICQNWTSLPEMIAQTAAVLSYILCMYILQRFLVFKKRSMQIKRVRK